MESHSRDAEAAGGLGESADFFIRDGVYEKCGQPIFMQIMRGGPPDPSGHMFWLVAVLLGAACGAAISAISGGNIALGALTGAISAAGFAASHFAIQALEKVVEAGALQTAAAIHVGAGAATGAIAGGFTSAMLGGSFGQSAFNGAWTAGFGMVFNDLGELSQATVHKVAQSWADQQVPYKWGGKDRNGADCTGSIWAIYKEAGIEYTYTETRDFSKSPQFYRLPDNTALQVGDIGIIGGTHTVMYDPNAGNNQSAWSATHTGCLPFGPRAQNASTIWYRIMRNYP